MSFVSSSLVNGDVASGDVDDGDNLSDEVTTSTDKASTSDVDQRQQPQQAARSPHDDGHVNGTGMCSSTVYCLALKG